MSEVVQNFQDLQVWQKARLLVQSVYHITAGFPKEEIYSLTSQMRRAAISIMSNITEGSSKRSTREFIRFINMSCGSLAEFESQLIIACDLAYCSQDSSEPIMKNIKELGRMLHALHTALQKRLEIVDA